MSATVPGLKRRFTQYIYIDDYKPQELERIYLDELARAGKRTRQGEADGEEGGADVARELIRYGTEGLLGMYRGTKMFAAVATVLQDMAS